MRLKITCIPGILLLAVITVQAQPDTAPKFPRVATIYSKKYPAENYDSGKKAIAKFDLYVSDLTWWGLPCGADTNCKGHASLSVGQYWKLLNPKQVDLVYQHSAFYDSPWVAPSNGCGYIIGTTPYYQDIRWLLCYAGSTLSMAMTTTDTVVHVNDLSKFAYDDYVLIGGIGTEHDELVKVKWLSGSSGSGTLHVHRTQFNQNGKFPAVTHASGDYIRSVVYQQGTHRSLAFNMTSTCPSTNINPGFGSQTWNQFITTFWSTKMADDSLWGNADGIFFDNFVLVPSKTISTNPTRIDYTNTNTATAKATGDLYWKNGMTDLANKMRSKLASGKLVLGNIGDSVSYVGAYLNGGMVEGVDQNGHNSFTGDSTFPGDSKADPAHFYNSWISGGTSPVTFIYNGSSTADTSLATEQADYKAMRFELTLAMMNNGYFVYDEFLMGNQGGNLNGAGHQSAWWYDEYDNAGAGLGYLGYPLGDTTQPIAGVYRRDFDKGVAICNTTGSTVKVHLGKYFKKINGTQDHTVNNGATVDSVTIAAKDGIILTDCANVQPPTALTANRAPAGITVQWTASTTAGVSYSVYRGWTNGNETFFKAGITGTSFLDSSAAAGIGYWYFVKAVIAGCDSSVSSGEVFKYACQTVAAPTNLTETAQTGKIILNWNASTTPRVTYSVYRGWLPGSETYYAGGLTDTTYTDNNVTSGVGYWYYINAVLSDCDSAASSEKLKYAVSHNNGVESGVGSDLNTGSPDSAARISIFPNPSHGEVQLAVTLVAGAGVNISVCNAQGDVIGVLTDGDLSTGTHQFTFHGGGLNGVYFIKIRIGNVLSTYKLLIL